MTATPSTYNSSQYLNRIGALTRLRLPARRPSRPGSASLVLLQQHAACHRYLVQQCAVHSSAALPARIIRRTSARCIVPASAGADVASRHATSDAAPADSCVSGNKQRWALTTTMAIIVTIGQGSDELSAEASGLRPRQRAGSVACRIARRSQPAHHCRDPGYLEPRTPSFAAAHRPAATARIQATTR